MAATLPIAWSRAMLADAEPRWSRLAARIAFASFLLSVLSGLLLPIYTDEIGWRMQLRAGIDGGVDRMLSDICGPNTIAVPPWFMMPFRHLSAWLNLTFPDPLYVRITGVAIAIGWAFLLRALIGRIAADPQQRARLTALAFALLGMGVLPIMLVMGRPDQIILLTMTAALLVAAIAAQSSEAGQRPTWFWAWLWPFVIVLLGIAAISSHLKGILVAPLFLVCIGFSGTGKRSWGPRILASLLFVAMAAQGANYWVGRFHCPGDPVMAGRMAEENLAGALAAGDDWRTIGLAALGGANPNTYIVLAEARPRPMSEWLPNDRISQPMMTLRYMAMSLAWNAAMLIGLICLVRALQLCWRERRLDLATAAPVVLAGLVLVWGMSQRVKNDYEIMLVLPMLALFCIYSLSAASWSPARARQLGIVATLAVAVSFAGQIDIARRYLPSLSRAAAQPGYVEGQHTSLSAYGYSAIRGQILATARQCGIGTHGGPHGRARHPLVDDATYFAMTDSWQPLHYLAVMGQWRGTIRDPLAYLKSRGSEGMILGCRNLSPELRRLAIQNGEFCCIATR